MKASSNKLRQQYKEDLINCLVKQSLSIAGDDSQYVMREDIYTDLLVLPSSEVDTEWNNSDREALLKQRHLERSSSEKAFDQLFSSDDELIVIRGVAGIGKTTLIDMFTYKWAKKQLQCQDFDFVFKFTCREMNEIADEVKTLEDLFKLKFPDIMKIITLQDLADLSERVLIIVDGLDELKNIYDMDVNCQSISNKGDPCLCVIFDLLNTKSNKLLGHHKTFACGRPKACEFVKRQLSQTCKTKTIEICGFNPQNVQKYIFNFFNDNKEIAEKVQKIIQKSSNLKVMSSVPVFLWVICSVFSENLIIDSRQINTNTELYFYSCLIFLRNHLQTSSNQYTNLIDVVNDEDVIKVVYSLMVLSTKTYMQNQVIFTETDIKMINCPVHLEKTGFIVKCSHGKVDESKYQFRHLILQEFLCSLHLCVTRNISQFKSNRELSSCTPTIHGIHRIIREAQNELFLKFYSVLEIFHAENASIFLPITKFWKNKSFNKFIAETEMIIPESMIEGEMLKIDERNPDCGEFLNIFKETNGYQMVITQSIKSAEIHLASYNDFKNILNLLEYLNIENVGSLTVINDKELSEDLLRLCEMVSPVEIVDVYFSQRKGYLSCRLHNFLIYFRYPEVDGDDTFRFIKGIMKITKTLQITFEDGYVNVREMEKVIEFGIENDIYIKLIVSNNKLDLMDGLFTTTTYGARNV